MQERKERQPLCKMCGTEIGERAVTGLCPACYAKSNRKVKRPEREVLKQMIRTLPFLEIGRQYGVSDNAVRKWCDAEGLPRKKTEIEKYSDKEWALI